MSLQFAECKYAISTITHTKAWKAAISRNLDGTILNNVIRSLNDELKTYCGLMTPYGDIALCQPLRR